MSLSKRMKHQIGPSTLKPIWSIVNYPTGFAESFVQGISSKISHMCNNWFSYTDHSELEHLYSKPYNN